MKQFDFLEFAIKKGYGKTKIPSEILIIILKFENHVNREVKKLNTPRVSNLACDFCGQPAMDGETHCEKCSVLRVI